MIGFFQQHWKLLGELLIGLLLFALAASWLVGGYICSPWNRPVKLPDDLSVEKVAFLSQSGATIHGWLAGSSANRAVVILQHGIRENKSSLVERARFLVAAGYAVLLYDFQAHGESIGSRMTFGYLESRDAQAAVEFVRSRFPGKPVGVIGLSLGAAAAVLAQPALEVQALVLEMMYPNVVDATKDRIEMRIGQPWRMLSPLLTAQLKIRAGCSVEDLCPLASVERLATPKLILCGTEDQHTKIEESEEIYEHAAEPKEFVRFEGARHEDLLAFAPEHYKRVVLNFLNTYLK
jgi:pimeloyl-ACP methyl ester carboxylesterase